MAGRKPPVAFTAPSSVDDGVVDLETGEWVSLNVEEEVDKKDTIFQTINALSSIRPLTYQDIVEENWRYEPFMINRAFSISEDTVLAASQMNERPYLDKDVHAAYYVHALRPRRRFEKWPKLATDASAKIIAQYYGMSVREAKLHLHLHTKEQVNVMRRVLEEGARPSRIR